MRDVRNPPIGSVWKRYTDELLTVEGFEYGKNGSVFILVNSSKCGRQRYIFGGHSDSTWESQMSEAHEVTP